MTKRPLFHRSLAPLVLVAFCFSLSGTLSLVPSVEAASASASANIIKKLKKQIANLKKQLAAAKMEPASFIEMVTVGNPGNTVDPEDGDGFTGGVQNFGAVPYEFKIGKTEVTLAQYTVFLNAVAKTDAFGLYHSSMATDLFGAGITQSGAAPNFTYSVIGTETRPVTYVNWFDAARFCNWLHNGRPTGAQTAATTERGAYTLDGAVAGVGFVLNRGAKFWIPSEDEWYKAAYHQPAAQLGDVDDYWLYPTKSNAVPGNTIGVAAPSNHANFVTTVYSVTQNGFLDGNQNYLTEIGSYPGSVGFYGTFDQAGNVYEWNDAVISGSLRGLRGGSWSVSENELRSSRRSGDNPANSYSTIGFRVASP